MTQLSIDVEGPQEELEDQRSRSNIGTNQRYLGGKKLSFSSPSTRNPI